MVFSHSEGTEKTSDLPKTTDRTGVEASSREQQESPNDSALM